MGIIDLIERTCSCDEKTAHGYLESEDYVEYFIRRVAMC